MAELLAGGDSLEGALGAEAVPPAGLTLGHGLVVLAAPAALGSTIAVASGISRGIHWPLAACWGAVAGLLCLLCLGIDRTRRLTGAVPSKLVSQFDVRALLVLALVLLVAHDTGLFPVGALGIAAASVAACGAAWVAARLLRSTRVLIVGGGQMATLAARTLESHGRATVIGFVDDAGTADGDAHGTVGRLGELPDLVRRHRADAVVFAFSPSPEREIAAAIRSLRESNVAVAIVPRLFEMPYSRVATRMIGGVPLMTLDPSMGDRRFPTLERVGDVIASAILLVLLAPVFIVVSLAIVVESPGPILYRADRVGRHGRAFSMLKFRKMHREAESGGSAVTRPGDERFTRVGRVLHAWKLDELPQLWNVLRGEMALVGPRPEDPRYVALFPDQYDRLLGARPGITGVAALKYRNETELLHEGNVEEMYRSTLLPDKLALERAFADRRSLGLTLRILLWTPVALVRRVYVGRTPETGNVWLGASRERS